MWQSHVWRLEQMKSFWHNLIPEDTWVLPRPNYICDTPPHLVENNCQPQSFKWITNSWRMLRQTSEDISVHKCMEENGANYAGIWKNTPHPGFLWMEGLWIVWRFAGIHKCMFYELMYPDRWNKDLSEINLVSKTSMFQITNVWTHWQ